MRNGIFTIYKGIDCGGEKYWWFTFQGGNYRYLHASRDFSTKQKAQQGIESFKTNALNAIIKDETK